MGRGRWSVGEWTLFAVGFVAAAFFWIGLAWIPRRLAAVDALRAFAAARGAWLRGDGQREPISIVGVARGRPFTVTWQRPFGGADVLLVGVDCGVEGADGEVLEVPAAAPDAITSAEGAALVTRWVRPGPDVLDPARLEAIVDALARMAEELEAAHPDAAPGPE